MDIYKRIIRIAFPIALQQVIFTSVNFVDTLMIGLLGEVAIASVGLSNQFFFLYNLILFGLVSGGGIFFAQYWGKKDEDGLSRSVALTILSSLLFSIPFFLLSYFTPELVLRFFSPDIEVIKAGIPYLKVIAFSYPLFAITMVFSFMLRSIGKAHLPLIITIIELSTNIVLNYLLIFGKLGFPVLGIKGAAIGTLIARAIGCTATVFIVYVGKLPGRAYFKHVAELNSKFVKNFFHYALPTLANEFAWSLGFTMYTVVYAHMGTDVIAAQRVMSTIEGLAVSVTFSIANAASVIIGNILGVSKFDEAFETSKKALKLAELISVIAAIVGIVTTFLVVDVFDVSEEVKNMVKVTIVISMAFLPVKIFNGMNVVGFLRAGGDTRFSFLVEASTLWLIGVPLAAVGGLLLDLSFSTVYFLTMMEEIIKSIILFFRYRSKKWLRNVLEEA
ncbi:multidrug transporter MATE [Petrotoga sp. HKA.pet.4.5]|uniref:MATE family efflux transporter n=1 Tax=unclassified Petrotoga TaxID=2620614 RepID=UPI000EF13D4E|nr:MULTISPECIES: MATE family efflux transporter [unclassified Petrotoga]RLL83979.1 multidrug transporter MATE [Petrotoga sp. Shatin.DS.tank11.9.2.9.3]RLL90397.1 multidrug transporter MATE [Petrotoga sp. HKA.pet.4.5]